MFTGLNLWLYFVITVCVIIWEVLMSHVSYAAQSELGFQKRDSIVFIPFFHPFEAQTVFLSARILINCCKWGFILRSMKAYFHQYHTPVLVTWEQKCVCVIPSLRQCILLSMESWLFSVRMFLSPLPQNNARQIANVPGSPSWKTNSLVFSSHNSYET